MDDFIIALQRFSTPGTYKKGEQLYRNNCVTNVNILRNIVFGIVQADRSHFVEIRTEHAATSYSCSCGYDDEMFCEHAVALFHHLYYKNSYNPHADNRVIHGSPSDISGNTYVKNRTTRSVSRHAPLADPIGACRDALDKLYEEAKNKKGIIPHKNRVRFNVIDNLANEYMDETKQIDIYLTAVKYISEHMDVVDNLKGHYTDQIRHMLRELVSTTAKKKNHDEKLHAHLNTLFDMYMTEKSDLFADMYFETLTNMCNNVDDFGLVRDLFELSHKKNKSTPRSMIQVLEAEALMLESMGSDKLSDFLRKHRTHSPEMYIKYIWILADHNKHDALAEAKNAIETFPYSQKISDILLYLSESIGGDEHKKLLCQKFIRTSDWLHYDRLKSESHDWPKQMKLLLSEIKKSHNPHMQIDVLLREGMIEDALHVALADGDLNVPDAYKHELGQKYPKEYRKAYMQRLTKLLESDSVTYDVTDMMRHMSVLQELVGHDDGIRKLHKMMLKRNSHAALSYT